MNPVTHFLSGWAVGLPVDLSRRDRALVTAAAVVPDLDGLGLVVDLFSGDTAAGYYWYTRFHHVLGHNALFGLLVFIAALIAAGRRWTAAFLCLVSFHVHLLFDLVGSKGPNDSFWAIPYLWPFFSREWVWEGQWLLNAWPNVVITLVLVTVTLVVAWKDGVSPVGLFSERADRALVETLRHRFGEPHKKSGIPTP